MTYGRVRPRRYRVKEIYRTIQGEGGLAGRVAVFCRFSGCNLWSGREDDRSSAICKWCDTDFVDGEYFNNATSLVERIIQEWGPTLSGRMVVLTGGEPALQYDKPLQVALRKNHFFIAIETNGTIALKAEADWICVSPKARTKLKQKACDEMKVIYPQKYLEDPDKIMAWPRIKSVQPMDGPDREANTQAAIEYCLAHPDWKLSLQTHKMVGLR